MSGVTSISTKALMYKVYGKFVEGLANEKKEIEEFLGIRDGF